MNNELGNSFIPFQQLFEDQLEQRRVALERQVELENLGADVIDRGAQRLMEKHGVDLQELEQSNAELSAALAKRIAKLDKESCVMPVYARETRRRLVRMMQHDATTKSDPILPGPAHALMASVIGECDDEHCRAEVATDGDLGRIHVSLIVTGAGNNLMRSGELWCSFIWEFVPDRDGRYLIEPQAEFHGRYSSSLEYHCYANLSGSRRVFEAYGSHYQHSMAGGLPIFGRMTMSLPAAHDLRYDEAVSSEYNCTLNSGELASIMISFRFQCFARSRFATMGYNFAGAPASDNFIGMPWIRYTYLGP